MRMRHSRKKYLRVTSSVAGLQLWWRRLLSLWRMRNISSAVRLQAWWRGWLRRRRMREIPRTVLCIQRVWRGAVGRCKARIRLVNMFRLRRSLRYLVRIRQMNRTRRQWRANVLVAYADPILPTSIASKEDLINKYLQLESHFNQHQRQVRGRAQKLERLQAMLYRTKTCGLFRRFGLDSTFGLNISYGPEARAELLLLLCLIIDWIGLLSYLIFLLGELMDLVWAPITFLLVYFLFGSVSMSALCFCEEIFLFTDIVPTATITWALAHVDALEFFRARLGVREGVVKIRMIPDSADRERVKIAARAAPVR